MLKWSFPRSCFGLCLVLVSASACQQVMMAVSTPTAEPAPITEPPPAVTATATQYVPAWEQIEVKDVRLGIAVPRGWQVQETGEGLLISERIGTMQSGTSAPGMQIHLFVHSLEGYQFPSGATNIAWAALEQIIAQPRYIGKARVSDLTGFKWDGQDAAYYLLNDGDGNLSILVAVAVATPRRLVVCNFSSPERQAGEIRHMLPDILGTLTINGSALDVAALHSLPDPLDFPDTPSNRYDGSH